MKKLKAYSILIILTLIVGIGGLILFFEGLRILKSSGIYSDKLIFILIVSIFTLGIIGRISRDWKRIKDFIKVKEIMEEEKEYSIINQKIKKISDGNSIILRDWENYIETLYYMDEKKKRFQTIDSEYFFNFDSLYKEKIRYKLYNHLPQAILGMGMLGTFYGLSKGLSALDLGNMTEIGSSVKDLLNGVKTAFYTSLFGLSYSILFSIFNNGYFSEIEKIIVNIKNETNKLFPMLIKEKIMDQIVESLQGIKDSNNDMATGLGNQIERMSKNLNENISEFSNTIGSDFKEEMSGAIGKIFNEDFIEKINISLSQMSEIFLNNSDKMKEFKEEIVDSIHELSNLKNSYGEVLKETSRLKVDFNETLGNINSKLSKTFEEIDTISVRYEES
ncbi:MAG: anti-phage ZorAB system protein ZorA, partial [Fusobacteriaceae bacterium]